MPCSPAVMMMNVNPALAQMLTMPSAGSAHVGSCSRPGSFSTSNGRMLVSTPIWGWSRTSQMREATATEVATVEE